MRKLIRLSLLVGLLYIFPGAPVSVASSGLKARIEGILKSADRSTKSSVIIYNPLRKDTLFVFNPAEKIIPASNIKLFTTAAALSMLGGNYEFQTKFLAEDSDFSDGIIDGNIYIRGLGNSLFSDSDMDDFAAYIKSSGINEVRGSVIGDDTYFDSFYSRDDWITDETQNYPLPPVSALIVNRNVLRVTLNPTKAGNKPEIEVSPECGFLKVINKARSTRSRSKAYTTLRIRNGFYELTVSGGIRSGRGSRILTQHIENPPLFAAMLLHTRLEKQGIKVINSPSAGTTPHHAEEVFSKGVKLEELLPVINKNSDNYLAECLFKAVGAYYSNAQGNSFYATQAIMNFLDENDIYTEGVSIVDGSGLSRNNLVTVRTMTGLLETMYFDENAFELFFNSLAIAGIDGTLGDRLVNTAAVNKFRAKTGSLRGVISISGYLTAKSGEDYIISIVFEFTRGGGNKYRRIQDQIIALVADEL